MFGIRFLTTRVGRSGSPVMTIFTGPSSTTMTSVICDGSSIDAKRLRTSTVSKRFAAFSFAVTAAMVDASNAIPTRTSASRRTSSSGVAVLPWIWIAATISGACAPAAVSTPDNSSSKSGRAVPIRTAT